MLRLAAAFLRGIGTLAWPWWIWMGLLVVVNGLAPLLFLGSVEAKAVLAAIIVGAVVQLALLSRLGFVRLLGLGHILVWVPLLVWLGPRLANLGTESWFGRWLLAVVLVDLASLAIDVVDVGRYLVGDRRPAPGTEPRREERR